jgi:glycosyltransferase involved in cell wall biosynthesis
VEDLRGFYDGIRVAISPVRFGSGVKLKTVQGMQYGVPTVATSIGAEGLTLPHGAGVHVADEPDVFARMLVRLMTDVEAWERSRQALIACVDRWTAMEASASWPRLLDDLYRGRQHGGA